MTSKRTLERRLERLEDDVPDPPTQLSEAARTWWRKGRNQARYVEAVEAHARGDSRHLADLADEWAQADLLGTVFDDVLPLLGDDMLNRLENALRRIL